MNFPVTKTNLSWIALLLILLGSTWSAISENASADTIDPGVIFPDEALETAVRREVYSKRATREPLTLEDLAKVSRVSGKGKKIRSLEGLQHCRFLLDLDLEDNEISDCSRISDLKVLQKLSLAGNRIDSIEPLSGLTSLQYLDVSRNQIQSLQAISGMRNLRSLYFEENQIRSLEPLAACKKLWSIYASKNPIENFSALATLSNVETLHLNKTGLSELSSTGLSEKAFQKGHAKLTNVDLRDNSITDLSLLLKVGDSKKVDPLNREPRFMRIDLSGNPLSEEARTEQLTKLRKMRWIQKIEFE